MQYIFISFYSGVIPVLKNGKLEEIKGYNGLSHLNNSPRVSIEHTWRHHS